MMHSGEAVPRVFRETKMPDVIFEMTRKGMGITTVVDGNKLAGVISDGDLRRLLQRGRDIMSLTAGECMTTNPKTIDGQEFVLTRGGLFLVSTKDKPTRVEQVVNGAERLQAVSDIVKFPELAKADPRITTFLESCKENK